MVCGIAHDDHEDSKKGIADMFCSGMLNSLFYCVDWTKAKQVASAIIEDNYRCLNPDRQIAAEVMLRRLTADRDFILFEESMNQLQDSYLYESNVHGKSHIERVAVLSFVLGVQLKLKYNDLRLCIEIAKYHDIGRQDEGDDEEHGYRGAQKINAICRGFSDQDRTVIAAVIAAHSLRDECCTDLFQRWKGLQENQKPRCKLLLDIIKDSDALDRFRLRDSSLDTRFLRLPNSLCLVRAACEMVHAFD